MEASSSRSSAEIQPPGGRGGPCDPDSSGPRDGPREGCDSSIRGGVLCISSMSSDGVGRDEDRGGPMAESYTAGGGPTTAAAAAGAGAGAGVGARSRSAGGSGCGS